MKSIFFQHLCTHPVVRNVAKKNGSRKGMGYIYIYICENDIEQGIESAVHGNPQIHSDSSLAPFPTPHLTHPTQPLFPSFPPFSLFAYEVQRVLGLEVPR